MRDKSKKMNAMSKELNKKIDRVRDELCGCTANTGAGIIRKVDNARSALRRGINGGRNELGARIDEVRADLATRIDERHSELYLVRESITAAKIWALALHITLAAGLLLVIARGFHWL
jgi:hypothetical protein